MPPHVNVSWAKRRRRPLSLARTCGTVALVIFTLLMLAGVIFGGPFE